MFCELEGALDEEKQCLLMAQSCLRYGENGLTEKEGGREGWWGGGRLGCIQQVTSYADFSPPSPPTQEPKLDTPPLET